MVKSAAAPALNPIREWHDVTVDQLHNEILTQNKPAVLRGYVNHWPIVQHARQSPEAVCHYLMRFDTGHPVDAVLLSPEAQGCIGYREDMNGYNFLRNKLSISAAIEQIARYSQFPNPPSMAVQSAPISDCLPGMLAENNLAGLSPAIIPRIWMGNAITTPAHMDESSNIACATSGRRRFTLFPPNQAANLYLGPIDYNPTGSPISMVDFRNPDFQRFPCFLQALATAQTAELVPGDAIYIPPLWWHHVESIDPLNILINYWWYGSPLHPAQCVSGFDSLLHTLLNLGNLPLEQKRAWQALFNHYIFESNDTTASHIPAHRRGLLGPLAASQQQVQRAALTQRMQKTLPE